MKNRSITSRIVLMSLAAGALYGCAEKVEPVVKPAPPLKVYVPPDTHDPNIVRVVKIFESFPWLNFSGDGSGRVDGFKCAVYLLSPTSRDKGVFGRGTMVVNMYRIDRDQAGRDVPVPVYEWQLPPEELFAYEAKKATSLGWGYGLRLRWGDRVDVRGCPIAVVIKFVREDGRVVSSTRQMLRVPVIGGGSMPLTQMPPRAAPPSRRGPTPQGAAQPATAPRRTMAAP